MHGKDLTSAMILISAKTETKSVRISMEANGARKGWIKWGQTEFNWSPYKATYGKRDPCGGGISEMCAGEVVKWEWIKRCKVR